MNMKQKQIEENLSPMKLIFNYEDVFYSFFYDDTSGCIHRSRGVCYELRVFGRNDTG